MVISPFGGVLIILVLLSIAVIITAMVGAVVIPPLHRWAERHDAPRPADDDRPASS